ncbi:MAG: conjugal transfer protein TraF [Gammaproteobacteria bacterium]|nr:conjugal transfer protein TraF [Gammaproteobacteria bacterium]
MKRLMTATTLTTAMALAQATPLYHPPGPNLTYGAVSNGQTIMSDITNPAAGAAALTKNGNQYRFGILGSVGAGFEFGKVDDLYERIDTETEAFQSTQSVTGGTPTEAAANLANSIDSLNGVLAEVEADGYAKLFASAHLPIMPLVVAHQALGGSLVFDVNGSVAARVSALHDTVVFNETAAAAGTDDLTDDVVVTFVGGAPTGYTIDNDSSLVIRGASTTELALGYSRPVMELGGGTLYGGLRGRYYTVGMARAVTRLGDLVNDAEQAFDDALDEDFVTDTGLGLDLGVLYVKEHFRLGATLTNLNEPEFEFGQLSNLGDFTDPEVRAALISSNSYTMERQLQLEAALYTASQNWVLSAAMDANAVADALGDDYQWATISAAYATDTWFLPGIRAGLRQNLAGTKVKYLTGGLTLGPVNLDVAYSPDTVTIDGESVPRGAIVNLGLELSF